MGLHNSRGKKISLRDFRLKTPTYSSRVPSPFGPFSIFLALGSRLSPRASHIPAALRSGNFPSGESSSPRPHTPDTTPSSESWPPPPPPESPGL